MKTMTVCLAADVDLVEDDVELMGRCWLQDAALAVLRHEPLRNGEGEAFEGVTVHDSWNALYDGHHGGSEALCVEVDHCAGTLRWTLDGEWHPTPREAWQARMRDVQAGNGREAGRG